MTEEFTTPLRRWCATMPMHHHLLEDVPGYAEERRRIEDGAFEWRHARRARRNEVITIPVVVHILWRQEIENIDDAQVHSQLRVLNLDFRRQNPDAELVPAVFRPLAADTRIEFTLATTAPDGTATTGITRTRTTAVSFDADDGVKSADTGGVAAWPSDRYLNIWVCQLRGGLLGYAQFPGGPPATDGVVITHRGFGTTGTATAPFDGGRTTVHEIGHWLNLRHIWGDDGEGCGGSDFVADTPNQAGPNTGRPEFPSISCHNGPNGDMFMNYMDYSDDAATAMFSNGQAERIDACLEDSRSSFLAAPQELPAQESGAPEGPLNLVS